MAVWPCVWQRTLKTADVTVTNIASYVRVLILMNRWFFPYLWHSWFSRYGHFVEYVTKPCKDHCDVNVPSISPRGSRSKAVADDYRHEYQRGCGHWTLIILILGMCRLQTTCDHSVSFSVASSFFACVKRSNTGTPDRRTLQLISIALERTTWIGWSGCPFWDC